MTTIRISFLCSLTLAAVSVGCSQNGAEPIESQRGSLVTANNTITQAADETRTGWFPNQPLLDPATVGSGNFKRLFKTELQPGLSQQVLAQPLVLGSQVLVATEANNLYLVDALTGVVTSSRNLGPTFDAAAIGCGDVVPTVGITGTPVVDTTSNTAYFYSKNSAADWTLHAVSTNDLSERPGFPVTISGSAQNDPTVVFNQTYELQRTGLLLMNGVVYAGFGSHCDVGPYRGWIIGVTTAGVIRTRYTTLANSSATSGGGVWMSGAGLATDGPGQILFTTGNGAGNPYTNPLAGNTPPGDLQNAIGRVVLQADGSLKTTDFFAPYNAIALGNEELGSGGIVVLPAQFGTPAIPHLAVTGGKAATLFLVNRDNLGGFAQGPGGSDAALAAIPLGGSSWSRPGVWPGDGGYVYVTVNGGTTTTGYNLQAFKYGTDASGKPTLTMVGKAPDNVGFFAGSPIVTSNGLASGSALVWMTNLTAELRIYDAVPVAGVLNIRFRDSYGASAKFTTIGMGAGVGYFGTGDGYLVAYGAGTPSVSGSPVAFGPISVGQGKTLTATITANQNVTINGLSSSSTAFTLGAPSSPLPVNLTAGQTLTVPVTFTPAAATGYTATLSVTTSSTPGALTMTGSGLVNGPQLAVSSSSLDFGAIAIATSKSLNVLLSNNGTSTLTFAGITAPAGAFSVTTAPANGATLAAGASTAMTVTFAPTAAASYSSSVVIGSNGGNVTVSLTGSAGAPGNLVVAPMNRDFGTLVVGTSRTSSFTLQNTGGTDLTIVKSKPPVLGPFVAQTSLPEGSTIAAGQIVTETVNFASNATGVLSDVWVLSGNDSTGVHNVTFTANSVTALSRTGWVATASLTGGADVPAQAIDPAGGTTRWGTGQPQSDAATQSFTLDMLSPQIFSMIQMDSGGDYPRVWELYASDDTANWGTAIATGNATTNPVTITFPTQTHRYLQIREKTSPGTTAWWSIYDMNVFGIPNAPPPPVDMATSPIVDMAGRPATPDLSVGSDGGGTPPSTGGCTVGGSDSLPTGIFIVGAMLVLFARRRRAVDVAWPAPSKPGKETAMHWEAPAFVELDMNAEIGGYQQDGSRETDEPVVESDDEQT